MGYGEKSPRSGVGLQGLELGDSTKVDRDVDVVEPSGLKILNKMLPKVVSLLIVW